LYVSTHIRKGLLLLFAIPVAYLLLWRILPAFASFLLSFTHYNMVWDDVPSFAGLENYTTLLSDRLFWNSMLRSVGFALAATFLEFLLALVLALLLDVNFRGRDVTLGIVLAPMVLTPAVVGIIWYIIYNERIGPLAYLLTSIGLPSIGWLSDSSFVLVSVILADVWQWTPFIFLLFVAYLRTVPTDLYEASAIDGASWWQVNRYIKIPLLSRIAAAAFLLRFMDAFREFDKIFVMTGGGPGRSSELVTVYMYKTAFQQFDIGRASAMLVVVLVSVSFIYAAYARKVDA